MFGWFRPQAPLDLPEKLWVDRKMGWLAQTVGMARPREAREHEYLTDLLTVFLGLGVFAGNSVIREVSYTYLDSGSHYWGIGRWGYLSERLFGYALSVFAWARGETGQAWAAHLRPNVRD